MKKSTEFTTGVINITNLAREVNPEIGSYQEHFSIENFGFIVLLSNGGVKISRELAHFCETLPGSVTKESIKVVAESYWRN